MILVFLSIAALLLAVPCAYAGSQESVVLLHGLGRTSRSMEPLARHLSEEGFHVVNLSYPSTTGTPEELVAQIERDLERCCRQSATVHFVGHSLGGILVRRMLETPRPNVGRLVMLGPPNGGSELVDEFGDSALFRWALGPSGSALGTSPNSLPNQLSAPSIPVGVIAGTRSINPLGSVVLPESDDGIVTVKSAKLKGMTDFIEVATSHTFIMRSTEVARQVTSFLKVGRFDRGAE